MSFEERSRALSHHLWQMVRFGLVGVVNTAVDLSVFWLMYSICAVPVLIANVISYGAGTGNSYALNKIWTFREIPDQDSVARQLPLFIGLNLIGLGLSTLIVSALASIVGAFPAKLVAVAAVFLWNYSASRAFVYRPRGELTAGRGF